MSQQLIEEYQKSVREKRKIRHSVTAAIFFIIICYGFLFYNAFQNFADQGVKVAVDSYQGKMKPYVSIYAKQIPSILERVAPVYVQEMEKAYNDRSNNIHLAINTELETLDELAIDLGQHLEKQSYQMAENQEELVNNGLAKILGNSVVPERVESIAIRYRIALEAKLSDLIDVTFKNHLATAEKLVATAKEVASRKEYKDATLDMNDAIGLTLQMLGKEIKES